MKFFNLDLYYFLIIIHNNFSLSELIHFKKQNANNTYI